MSNLLASLVSTAGSLEAYGRVLETAQNNVANSSTPGYAKQSVDLYALPFDPEGGVTGGVRAGKLVSSRNEFAEQAVRQQTSGEGYQQQLVESLTAVQSNFDISGNQGIPQALNNLFQSFSAWGATPDNQAVRQTVVQRATDLAQSFQDAARNAATQAHDAEQQIGQTVDQVNQLVGQLQNYNRIALQGNAGDTGLSANMHSALEQLATLVDVQSTFQSDGTVSLMLNGATPLLLGDKQYALQSSLYKPQDPPPANANSPANVRLQGSDGSDITAQTTGAQLGALLHLRNQVLPTFIGDAYQAGDLNVMAKQFADRVNQLLTSGNITDGPPAVAGVPLFTYNASDATATAASLAVVSGFTPDQLAAITPSPVDPNLTPEEQAALTAAQPEVSNGVPLALSALASPIQDADKVNGMSYSQFFGQLAGRVGTALSDATNNQDVQQSLLAQAKDMRQQYQGVSLDEEATILMQFQRAYQANSKFINVLDQLTQSAIDILHV
jgi:flagellar hook-associated protein 1